MIHNKITLCTALTDEFYQDMIAVTDESSQKKMGGGEYNEYSLMITD